MLYLFILLSYLCIILWYLCIRLLYVCLVVYACPPLWQRLDIGATNENPRGSSGLPIWIKFIIPKRPNPHVITDENWYRRIDGGLHSMTYGHNQQYSIYSGISYGKSLVWWYHKNSTSMESNRWCYTWDELTYHVYI